jgi:hypothetical protein
MRYIGNKTLDLTGPTIQVSTPVTGNTIDCSRGNYFTQNVITNTTYQFTNVPQNRVYMCSFEIANAGNYVITWPLNVKWPSDTTPTLSNNGTDILVFVTDDGGTIWRSNKAISDTE